MDPISILGITAATMQFIDFGARLLKTVAAAGLPLNIRPDEQDLRRDARELADLAQAIRSRVELLDHSESDRLLTPIQAAILSESQRCVTVGLEISESIGKDQSQNTKSMLDKISAAFKNVWNERSALEMRAKLVDARSSLMLAIISSLW